MVSTLQRSEPAEGSNSNSSPSSTLSTSALPSPSGSPAEGSNSNSSPSSTLTTAPAPAPASLQRSGSESLAGSLAEGSNPNLPLLSPLSPLPPFPAPTSMGNPNKSSSSKPKPKPENKRDEAYLNTVTEKRIKLFESIQAQQLAHRRSIGGDPIKITMKDGVVKEGKKWLTSPMDVAREISVGLASSCLIAQVNGALWDMNRPLEGDCTLVLFKFDSDEGRDTFWHSSAHILGEALEREYGCKLCIGPCTTRGEYFFLGCISLYRQTNKAGPSIV